MVVAAEGDACAIVEVEDDLKGSLPFLDFERSYSCPICVVSAIFLAPPVADRLAFNRLARFCCHCWRWVFAKEVSRKLLPKNESPTGVWRVNIIGGRGGKLSEAIDGEGASDDEGYMRGIIVGDGKNVEVCALALV